ncbi:MAG: MltA domain-containing protein [Deltaproteobacteria bacterium]|nr:MltA domain-containing protein [Deltaproteobacteria bacterium]
MLRIMRPTSAAKILSIVGILAMLSGCAAVIPRAPGPPLSVLPADEIPLLIDESDVSSLEDAIEQSLVYYERLPNDRLVIFGPHSYTVEHLKNSLKNFLEIMHEELTPEERQKILQDRFIVYRSSPRKNLDGVLFTGYYAPLLHGSRVRTESNLYPIYRTPDDYVVADLGRFRPDLKGRTIVGRIEGRTLMPYHSRREIDCEGRLEGKSYEIAWFDDPVDIFFLHIQGSGIVSFDDGSTIVVSYDAANGRPYRSLGGYFIDRGILDWEGMSLPAIRRYLSKHPEEMWDILSHNESYVFFRVVENGPLGALNVPVTAGRTIATDLSLYPRGALAFIQVRQPLLDDEGEIQSWVRTSRFVVNQDTGGAITGTGRVDLFCGAGARAAVTAGHMKEIGELYFLVERP